MVSAVTQPHSSNDKLHQLLHRVFGFAGFRANQEDIVRAILKKRDVVAILPTGSGKSLCYQLPAKIRKGTCVVVSPLIALMKDQVDAATAAGIRAAFMNSTLTREQAVDTYRALRTGELDLLYIAPERFALDGFSDTLAGVDINLFAIDEAHCVSEWGLDFRPDYLGLSRIKELFPHVPVAAFTATATLQAQQDIVTRLGLHDPFILRASFDRPNLHYAVRLKGDLERQIAEVVAARPGQCGIVYRTTRKHTETTAAALCARGIKALPYHAGLDPAVRKKNQDRFMGGKVQVIVATIAFGMGIDKPDIRFVLHGDLPKNMESYYQETGRAGRDGEPSDCILFFSFGDIRRVRFLIEQAEDEKFVKISLEKLNHVIRYAEQDACRRRAILAYFDEAYEDDNCGSCDVCSDDSPKENVTPDAKLLLDAISETGERFGAKFVIHMLRGDTDKDDRIKEYGHIRNPSFGTGRHLKATEWKRILHALLADGAVVEEGEYSTLRIARPGMQILSGLREVHVRSQSAAVRPGASSRKRAAAKKRAPDQDAPAHFDRELFEKMRRVRAKLAATHAVPPYRVCGDRTLKHICAALPRTESELAAIPGMGPATMDNYGRHLLRAIAKYAAPDQSSEPIPAPPHPRRPAPPMEPPARKQPAPAQAHSEHKPTPEPARTKPATAPAANKPAKPPHKDAARIKSVPDPRPATAAPPSADSLRRDLLDLRVTIARQLMVPPDLALLDPTIEALCKQQPATMDELKLVFGIGAARAREHGQVILDVIRKHSRTTPATAPAHKKPAKKRPAAARPPQPQEPEFQGPAPDADLHQRLSALRTQLAERHRILLPYVFPNKTIDALARVRPRTPEDLLIIPGIGPRKAEKFGPDILRVIDEFLAEPRD